MSFAPPLVGESALDSAGLWLLSIGACLAGLRTYFDGTLETARALVIESTRLGGRIVAPIAPAAGAPRLIGQDVAARVLTVACDHVGELQRRAVVAVSRRAAPIGMMFEPRAGQASEPGPPVTSAVSAWLLLGSAAGCAWRAAAAKIKRGEDKNDPGRLPFLRGGRYRRRPVRARAASPQHQVQADCLGYASAIIFVGLAPETANQPEALRLA